MTSRHVHLLLATSLAVAGVAAMPPANAKAPEPPVAAACDIASTDMGRLRSELSSRAIEVVRLAAQPAWKTDARLTALVAQSAEFSLGGGDVGRPLGTGPSGARALVEMMHADSFRYPGWDYIPTPADGCASHKVTIEFSDTEKGDYARVEFDFLGGRMVAGKGWAGSFTSGTLTRVAR